MARPERNTVDYFPYLCDEGEKMYYIDERYGNDGFATFIKILTHLARTDYHYLDLSKKTTQMFLSAKCKVSTEILNSIITDLSELGKFNNQLWSENKIIWCQDFIDSIQDAYKKRNNQCISFDGLLILLDSLGVRKLGKLPTTTSVKPQSKVEYSIEEETKEEDNKGELKISAAPTLSIEKFKVRASISFEKNECTFGTPFKKLWLELIQTKKWKTKEQSAINASLKKLLKYDEIFASILVENAIAGGYQGVEFTDTINHYEKYLKQKNGTGTTKEESRNAMADFARSIIINHQTQSGS